MKLKDQNYDILQVTNNASPVTPINYFPEQYWMSLMTLLYWECMTFDSKMTFEKHPRSFSRAASKRLGILKKSWKCSMMGDGFGVFTCPFWSTSAVWCSAADTQFKLLDRTVSGDWFLTGGVVECDFAHRRSVAVLFMLYKIRGNSMQPVNDALPGPYVPVRLHTMARLHIGILIRHFAAEHRSTAWLLYPSVGQAGFKSRANAFLLS